MSVRSLALVVTALAATLAVTGPASAFRGGGSQEGDSYLNDAQKNPRFIEPGAQNDPSRYRQANPREGYYDRQADAYYGQPYQPHPYRGRVTVRPYGY